MKNVLLLAHDDDGQEARLQAALDLTRAIDGHLTCIDVLEVPVLNTGPWSGLGHGVLVAEAQRLEENNRKRIRERLGTEDVAWDWHDMSGDIADCLTQAAGLADVIVTSARTKGFLGLSERHVAADILVRSRTPILAVPDALRRFDPTSAAILSWDGSEQVTAALHAAVPLLRLAQGVVLVEVDDGSVVTPAEEAAAYLSRHDIASTVQRVELRFDPIVKTLIDAIAQHRAGLVVMGAFRHWRMTEAIFGGVTTNMLARSPVPLFMAH